MNLRLRSLASITTLLLAFTPVIHAADPQPAPAPATAAPAELVSIDFPGGPLTKLLSMIGQNEKLSFNVIAGNAADLAVEVPPFAIRNADLGSFALVLHNVLEPRGYQFIPVGGRDGSFVCTLTRIEPSREEKLQQHQFESFQLAPYLEQQSVDDIVDAMRTAWELDPTHKPDALRLKFHPPTSILLVSGPYEAITLTRAVLIQLNRSPDKKADHKEPLQRLVPSKN